jgi:hypothetical protein
MFLKKIKNYTLIATLCCFTSITQGQKLLVNMPGEMIPVKINSSASKGRVSGDLPKNWRENSDWAKAWAVYKVVKNKNGDYLQVKVTKVQNGYCQFDRMIKPTPKAGNYRLSFMARLKGRAGISAGIRLRGKPYSWLNKFKIIPSQQWQSFEFNFVLKDKNLDKFPSIFFVIDNSCLFELKQVKLQLRPQESENKIITQGNLLRNSCFPLGLQSGWTMSNYFSDGDDVKIKTDSKLIGPSGFPSLSIEALTGSTSQYGARNKFTLYSAPLAMPELNKAYCASIYVAGKGIGQLAIYSGKRCLGKKSFNLKKQSKWRRIEIPFTPKKQDIYYLRFDLKGKFNFDAAQVIVGKSAGLYKARMACEVALAMKKSDASRAKILFEDEAPIIKYAVSGKNRNSVLKIKLNSIKGQPKTISIPLKSNLPLQYGQFNINKFKTLPFGPTRIEAWVTNSSGKRISTFNEMIVNLLRRPHYWGKDAPESAFATHAQPVNRHIAMAKAIGNNWIRLHDDGVQLLGWAYLEKEPGKWTFDDAGIKRYRDYKLKLLGELTTAPAWESYATKSTAKPLLITQTVTAPYFLPLSINKYSEYVRKIVSRYKDQIDCYDVWNEPWLPLFFHTDFVKKFPKGKKRWASFGGGWYISPDNPAVEFIKLQEAVYKTTKAINPKFKVLGFNTSTGEGKEGRTPGKQFTAEMLKLGAVKSCDVISYHQYLKKITGYPGDEVSEKYKWTFASLIKKYGENFPHQVWLSEGSPLTDPSPGFYNYTIKGSSIQKLSDESDRVVRFVVSLLANKVKKVFLYSMAGSSAYFTQGSPHRMFITANGDLHPVGSAYSAMTWSLENKKFVKVIKVGKKVYAYIFSEKGKSTAVLLADPRASTYSYILPKNNSLEILDLFGNPVKAGTAISPYATYLTIDGNPDQLEKILNTK